MLEHIARELDIGDGVRLWLVRLDDDAHDGERLSLLSPDERERAASYPGASRGRRFVRGRGALRVVLGELAGIPPADLRFAYGRDGKPSLAAESGAAASALHFNVSHARDLALIAVAQGHRVGVDIAWTRGEMRLIPVVERFFSSPERSAFEGAIEAERRHVFARIWVRKEAYLKGRGEGISERIYETDFSETDFSETDFSETDFSETDFSETDFSGTLGERGESAGPLRGRDQDEWELRDVSGIDDGFVASVAVERGNA